MRPPAPPRPDRPERRGGGEINSTITGIGGGGRRRESGGGGRLGAHSPLLGPDAPVPAARAGRPAGEPSGAPRKIRPSNAAVPPGGPGRPEGARGGPGCGGRARPLRRPPARGLTGAPTPTPARAGRAARPAPAPAAPPPGGLPSSTVGAPQAPESPAPATPAPAPLTLSFSARGLARAGESPASHQSERRWQWTRKLGRRCYCSPLGSGKSLSLSSKRAKKAGLPELHKKRQQPPTAPLQALRGHNTREQLLCPPKRQLSYHLGGRGKGGRGEKCTRSR
ncbi:basic salivary proline-rich protein 4-like [Pseudorca crassidens]|uniref:basic salivary proline-rich protein 4-like n=1 Tax=Pseudorca crassidens TaxID=82174 RepID=UPI00352C5DFD